MQAGMNGTGNNVIGMNGGAVANGVAVGGGGTNGAGVGVGANGATGGGTMANAATGSNQNVLEFSVDALEGTPVYGAGNNQLGTIDRLVRSNNAYVVMQIVIGRSRPPARCCADLR